MRQQLLRPDSRIGKLTDYYKTGMQYVSREMAVAAIEVLYQRNPLVPQRIHDGCPYVPTCSNFAIETIRRFGVLRGGLKAANRLARCDASYTGGFSPLVDTPEMYDN